MFTRGQALLRQVGVSVVSVSEPLDPDSPAAVIVEGVLEAVNEWYSVNLGREVAKGLKQRAEQGLWNGDLPFGYVKGDDGLARVVPEEADDCFHPNADGHAALAAAVSGVAMSLLPPQQTTGP